jgi:hypothetical protein
MPRPQQRRQQRVAYATTVRLHAVDSSRPWGGRTVNLSRSGVLVESQQACPVGTELVCEIPFPAGEHHLAGRVARADPLPDQLVGLGIKFTALGQLEEDLLAAVVGHAEDDDVAPIPETTLEEAPLSPGNAFANGGRRRAAPLVLVDPPPLDGEATVLDPVIVIEPTGPRSPAPAAAASSSSTDASGPRRRRRAMGAAAAILIGTGLGVAAGGALALLHRRGTTPPSIVARAAVAPRPAPVPARGARSPDPGSRSPEPVAGTGRWPPPQPAPAPPRPALPPPLPDGTPGPTVDTTGAETVALVPVSGSTDGMTHRSLFHPRGLAVNLPQAQPALPVGVHRIERDGLRFVWIRDRGEGGPRGGLEIRFIFSSPPPDERLLELEEDAVRIRVRRHEVVARERSAANL